MKVLQAIGRAFSSLPDRLQRFIGVGIAVGIALGILALVFLFWGTGYVQDQLGLPSKKDIQEVSAAVRDKSDEQAIAAAEWTANYVVKQAMDSARAAQDSLFTEISDAVIEPGIRRLNNIEARTARLEQLMGQSNALQRQQLDRTAEANDRIGELGQLLRTDQPDMNAVLQALQQINERLDAVEQEAPRRRDQKQKF